jgi:hypothetical protein
MMRVLRMKGSLQADVVEIVDNLLFFKLSKSRTRTDPCWEAEVAKLE